MACWQLGNTTVRSALRLREGLMAYADSDIQGAIRRTEGDIAFRRLLGEAGLVSLGSDATNSVGRKWRSALGKLGFIYPEVKKSWGFDQGDLGPCDYITPAGHALLRATTMPAIYEAYLRALAVPLRRTPDGRLFAPLRWVLALLLTLEDEGAEGYLSFDEMACFVQTSDPTAGRKAVCQSIVEGRQARRNAVSAAAHRRVLYERAERESGVRAETLRDYADENIRYLKATGMVRSKGRGICLVDEKRYVARSLSDTEPVSAPLLKFYRELCEGADLPTDDVVVADAALRDVMERARSWGVAFDLRDRPIGTPSQANAVRFEIEELIAQKEEERYAADQVNELEEIKAYLHLLVSSDRHCELPDGTRVSIPKDERPAYLEWVMWRSFLAIDSLRNAPYEVRRFNVDGDFKPVSTAPGKGSDLVAEFDDFVLAVEVTMSTGSRQEAMEGEPVRRHVADLAARYDKPVLGLFVAVRVNLNTVETFRHGIWYTADEERMTLSIVPMSLQQFAVLFESLFSGEGTRSCRLRSVLGECLRAKEGADAPRWRGAIAERITEKGLAEIL